MGHTTRFAGEIAITPPLTWAEIRERGRPVLRDLRIRLEVTGTDTAAGQVRWAEGVAVTAAYGEGNGYGMVDELQALADSYGGHRFTGYIEAWNDEGDCWRLLVNDGQAVRVSPDVMWAAEQRKDSDG